MPIYEYQCEECNHVHESLEDMDTHTIVEPCTNCENLIHNRIVSATVGLVKGGISNKAAFNSVRKRLKIQRGKS